MSSKQVNEAVGRAFRAMREKKGLSQSDVAEALGTTQPTVSRWEGGQVMPDVGDVTNYAYVTGTTPSALLAAAYQDEKAIQAVVPKPVQDRARRLEREINTRHFRRREE